MNSTSKNFNPSELASLIRLAVYSKTIVNFSRSAGLSDTIIYRALRCTLKSRPTIKTLCKIADASEGRVSINQLLLACGYNENKELFSNNSALRTCYVITSDDISKIMTQIQDIGTKQQIVVLVKNINTILSFKQTYNLDNKVNVRFALLVE